MTTRNKLIKLAKTTTEPIVYIRQNEVRAIAEHMRISMCNPNKYDIDFFVHAIERGDCRILGKYIRVKK